MITDGVRRYGGKPPLILMKERVVGGVQEINPSGVEDKLLGRVGIAEEDGVIDAFGDTKIRTF